MKYMEWFLKKTLFKDSCFWYFFQVRSIEYFSSDIYLLNLRFLQIYSTDISIINHNVFEKGKKKVASLVNTTTFTFTVTLKMIIEEYIQPYIYISDKHDRLSEESSLQLLTLNSSCFSWTFMKHDSQLRYRINLEVRLRIISFSIIKKENTTLLHFCLNIIIKH